MDVFSYDERMGDGVSINIGEALCYLENRTRALFGKDPVSEGWRRRLNKLNKLSMSQASAVQCIGMSKPIPISEIYQPTRLIARTPESQRTTVDELLRRRTSCVIFAGPGWGKTTLLHWVYTGLCRRKEVFPILFTLRWPGVLADLTEFIDYLASGDCIREIHNIRLVLLVDGYDEIAGSERLKLSKSLMLYSSLGLGEFYLTCRSHYLVHDLIAEQFDLDRFTQEDSHGFILAFSKAYGRGMEPSAVLSELRQHGFTDFASHPLMLALVCILKTSPNPEIPRRAIGLIERALDTLTFKWDEAKMIHRPSMIPLDGRERTSCLMRVAFDMTGLQASLQEVEKSVSAQLYLLQRRKVDIRKLLEELAQWYGILIPVEQGRWTFVHRTIHDFLAARFWVETGAFSTQVVREWNIRAAYAACLVLDATATINRMLVEAPDIMAFSECLYNGAPFNPTSVAMSVVRRVGRRGDFTLVYKEQHVDAQTGDDFYESASFDFLRELVSIGSNEGSEAGQAVAFCALSELGRRQMKISPGCVFRRLQAIWAANTRYEFHVQRRRDLVRFRLSDVLTES